MLGTKDMLIITNFVRHVGIAHELQDDVMAVQLFGVTNWLMH
jgi:hypothetical protein